MFGFWKLYLFHLSAQNNGEQGIERMMNMDRQQLPSLPAEPDIAARTAEIRLPARSENHEARSAGEVRP